MEGSTNYGPVYRNGMPAAAQEESRKKGCCQGSCCILGFLGCAGLIFVVAMGLIFLLVLGLSFAGGESSELFQGVLFPDGTKYSEQVLSGNPFARRKIAVIPVEGIILSSSSGVYNSADSTSICEMIRKAENDPSVKAIILDLNTPGGEVTASDIIHHEVGSCTKPVVAMMNSIAASGGYYIAAGCDRIVANRLTLTGSIGVIIQTYNYAGLFQKIGLKSEAYTSGPMKNMLDGATERTPAEVRIIQELIQNTYMEFVKIVSEGRGIPVDRIVGHPIGDGRIFDGVQALANGLVDELGFFEDAVDTAAELAGLPAESCTVVRYTPSFSFASLFAQCRAGKNARQHVQVNLPGASAAGAEDFIPEKGKMYFLPFAN